MHARLLRDARLLERAREDGRGARPRPLDAHGRPRGDGRGRLPADRRPDQGHGHPRRREPLPARGGGVPLRPPRRGRRAGRRGPRPTLRRGADGMDRPPEGPALRRDRRRVPDDGHRQGAEVQAARDGDRAAGAGGRGGDRDRVAGAARRTSLNETMCGRFTLTKVDGHGIAQRFDVPQDPEEATLGRFNVCPTEQIAIVSAKEGERKLCTVRWGLVPSWAKELGKGHAPINARSETVASKKPFADLFARPDRRCLVVADGWYEWLRSENPKQPRVPFRYTVDGGEPFAFAGLFGWTKIGEGFLASATILVRARTRSARPCTTACRWCSAARRRRPP